MHKWRRPNKTIVLLCQSCSQKEYKKLEIREGWKVTEREKNFQCEMCGLKQTISIPAKE